MLSRLQQWVRHSSTSALFVVTFVMVAAPAASAQEQSQPFLAETAQQPQSFLAETAQEQPQSFLADTLKKVVFDPTTYAPAAIAYDATMRDWSSSRPFFRHGYLERNERYTISGRPNDIPMGHAAGQRRILRDAFQNLQVSLVSNVAGRAVERKLKERFPNHHKLVRTLGWAQRIGVAAYLSYRLSAAHYRQAAENERRALQLGYR